MIVGILSDTHDCVEAAREAIELLRRGGTEFYIHCGDVGSGHILDLLVGLPAAFVFGNCDWDRQSLQRYATDLKIQCLGSGGEVNLGGKSFYITHGDDNRALQHALTSQRYDYVMHGHTHAKRDERVGRTRVINPGALHRARVKTVALLDTERNDLRFIVVGAAQ